jgi:ribosomal protein L37AE/L43A
MSVRRAFVKFARRLTPSKDSVNLARRRRRERYKEYAVAFPNDEEHEEHEAVETMADGVWFCVSCGEHYRKWCALDEREVEL